MMTKDTTHSPRKIGLALGTALASIALSGCALGSAPEANISASKASAAMERGATSKAVRHAEAAALASPRDAQYRVMLGAAYMQDGRFQSAQTSFAEAMELGDESAETVLSRALAMIGAGEPGAAHALLSRYRNDIAPGDLGLAFALAGDPKQGAYILSDALRHGQNDGKNRQNFAYALALLGDWRAARIMVAEDVPADQVGPRIAEWAQLASPGFYRERVARLLDVELDTDDAGRPQMLALANHPTVPMMAAEVGADQPAATSVPPVQTAKAAPAPAVAVETNEAPRLAVAQPGPLRVDIAPSQLAQGDKNALPVADRPALAPVAKRTVLTVPQVEPKPKAAPKPVAKPVVRVAAKAPVKPAAKPAVKPASTVAAKQVSKPAPLKLERGDYNVQLGSYLSEADAKSAWGRFQDRYPALKDARVQISEAKVNGKTYFRVAAASVSQGSAKALCGAVKRSGGGCLAYAKANPLPGTVRGDVRMASR